MILPLLPVSSPPSFPLPSPSSIQPSLLFFSSPLKLSLLFSLCVHVYYVCSHVYDICACMMYVRICTYVL